MQQFETSILRRVAFVCYMSMGKIDFKVILAPTRKHNARELYSQHVFSVLEFIGGYLILSIDERKMGSTGMPGPVDLGERKAGGRQPVI